MPNLKNWSRKEAITLFEMIGIKYNIEGYGYVTEQSIESGTIINNESEISIKLSNKYDVDKDGDLSLEEYQNFRMVRTRDDRRMERRARKNGTYVSPEDVFKRMDTNEDGVVTKDEMLEYEKNSR